MAETLSRAPVRTSEPADVETTEGGVERASSAPVARVIELRSRVSDPVSPELVLIDPDLARRERDRLASPAPAAARRAPAARARIDRSGRPSPVATAFEPTAPPAERGAVAPSPSLLRSARLRWGVAATVLVLGILGGRYWLERSLETTVHEPALTGTASTPAPPPAGIGRAATPPKPSVGVGATTVRTLAWAPVAGATEYELQLFRGSRRVYVKRTRRPRLTLPEAWRYAGRVVRLEAGRYRWQVWPLGAGGKRLGPAIVQAQILIARR